MDLSAVNTTIVGLPVGQVLNSSTIQDIVDMQQPHHSGTPHYNSSTCPDSLLDTSNELTINTRNLCPWVYITDEDDDR